MEETSRERQRLTIRKKRQLDGWSRRFNVLLIGVAKGENRENKGGTFAKKQYKKIAN